MPKKLKILNTFLHKSKRPQNKVTYVVLWHLIANILDFTINRDKVCGGWSKVDSFLPVISITFSMGRPLPC